MGEVGGLEAVRVWEVGVKMIMFNKQCLRIGNVREKYSMKI